jgi:hypothetical protein
VSHIPAKFAGRCLNCRTWWPNADSHLGASDVVVSGTELESARGCAARRRPPARVGVHASPLRRRGLQTPAPHREARRPAPSPPPPQHGRHHPPRRSRPLRVSRSGRCPLTSAATPADYRQSRARPHPSGLMSRAV